VQALVPHTVVVEPHPLVFTELLQTFEVHPPEVHAWPVHVFEKHELLAHN
jgi:hypothetical protein